MCGYVCMCVCLSVCMWVSMSVSICGCGCASVCLCPWVCMCVPKWAVICPLMGTSRCYEWRPSQHGCAGISVFRSTTLKECISGWSFPYAAFPFLLCSSSHNIQAVAKVQLAMKRIQANKFSKLDRAGQGERKGVGWWNDAKEDRARARTISPWVLLFPGHPAVFTEMVLLLPGAVFCPISISGQGPNTTIHRQGMPELEGSPSWKQI